MDGYLGVLGSAFLAATLVPFSSEVILATLAFSSAHSTVLLWLYATTGNVAGSVVNWGIGRYCLHFQKHRGFPFTARSLDKARRFFLRYGMWSLLLTWIPVVGDPLAFMGGVFRVPLLLFVFLVSIGKGARYAAVLWMLPTR